MDLIPCLLQRPFVSTEAATLVADEGQIESSPKPPDILR
jgi:hypothetical protein